MSFQPATLHPDPDPSFIRELHIIDKELRLVWGYDRYLKRKWVIERRIQPDRYAAMYWNHLVTNQPRYVDQPIYDDDQPIYDELGNIQDSQIVGYRKFDMCPEWEWIATVENRDGTFKQPGQDDLLSLRRQYAWNYNHPLSRHKFEEEERIKQESKQRAERNQSLDMYLDAIDQSRSEQGVTVMSKPYSVK